MAAAIAILAAGCRHDVVVDFPGGEKPGGAEPEPGEPDAPSGFYLLNQGNMGMNKASIDFYDYATGEYTRNVYTRANPDAVMALGDVGNQIMVYRDRLWAIINASNKIEVMNAADCRRIGKIDIPNCRYMAFYGDYMYVTSYAGPIVIDDDYEQLGYVARINVATLREEGRCIVRYQPDGLAISGGRIYVANSGGYRPNNYEKTLSVIDMDTFTVVDEVELGINLDRVVADAEGKIWVSSRGDYYDVKPYLYCYDPRQGAASIKRYDVEVSSMWLQGTLLYCLGNTFSYETMESTPAWTVVDTGTAAIVEKGWSGAAEFRSIKAPYCVAIDPVRGDIYITDAGNYVNPGYLYSFTSEGEYKWRQRTGDIPSSIAFVQGKVDF